MRAAVELLDGGATVPFIARYRKEVTGALDDAQLRTLEERLRYLRELEERRAAILESDRGAGQARRRAARADPRGRHQGAPGGHLPARSSPSGAPRRRSPARPGLEPLADALLGRPDARPADRRRRVRRRRQGRRRRRRRARRRPGDPRRALRRGRRPHRRPARALWERGRLRRQGPRGQGGGGREVLRLLRLRRAARQAALAPHPRPLPGREGGGPLARLDPEEPAAEQPRPATSTRIAAPLRHRRPGPPRRPVAAPTPCAGPGAPASSSTSASTCGCGCGRRPRTRPCACSPPTCATCCSPPPPAPARPWASTPGFRTGVKVAVVDATGKVVATDTIYPHEPAAAVGPVAGHPGRAGRRSTAST